MSPAPYLLYLLEILEYARNRLINTHQFQPKDLVNLSPIDPCRLYILINILTCPRADPWYPSEGISQIIELVGRLGYEMLVESLPQRAFYQRRVVPAQI